MPNATVGICFFSLGGSMNASWSVPFPVAQAPRQPHWRFNADHPTGVQDASIVASSTAVPVAGEGGRRLSGGAIAGVVIGVLVGVVLLAWLCCWRKRKRSIPGAKGVGGGEDGQSDGEAVVGSRRASPQVELQTVQRGGVERKVERDEEGEAPPAYHEVVRAGTGKEVHE
jgi:hypothetical protein